MSYTPTNWENGKTPINATNLNNMESGIKDNSDRLDTVESTLSGHTTKISNVEQTANSNSDRLDAVEGSVGNIETELTEVNNRLDNISEEVDLTEIEASIDTINGKIGTTDISDVGDGTMTGAIRELADNPSSGGGSGDTSIWISQAEYDALSEEEKEKDVDYYIYDADGDGNAFTTPFSSEKYEAENVGDALNEVKEAVNTANSNLDKLHQTFSGVDINTILDIANGFCDGACTNIPNAGNPGFLEVIRRNDTNIVMQRFTQNSDKRVFTRSYVGGTWSAWVGVALNSDLGKELLGTKQYAGHWIYDGNSASPFLFIPLPSFYQNYNIAVSTITVQGVDSYSGNITMSKYANAIVLKHASVTGTAHNGKLGFATITFS